MAPIHPTPAGSNRIICRKVRPPVGSWIGKAAPIRTFDYVRLLKVRPPLGSWTGKTAPIRTLDYVRLLEVRLPLGSMARRYSES